MARPTLLAHRKFRRLCAMTGLSIPKALGHLELIWMSAYESGQDYIGDSLDVELAAHWDGESGLLTQGLLKCGGNGKSGFIDETEDGFIIHDLWDHAPEYVSKRFKREMERQESGQERKHTFATRTRSRMAPWREKLAVHCTRYVKLPASKMRQDDGFRQPKTDLGGINSNGTDLGSLKPIKADLGSTPSPAPSPRARATPPFSPPGGRVKKSLNNEISSPQIKTEKIVFDPGKCKLLNITPQLISIWKEKFPALDIPDQIKKMEAWLLANPKNRKSNYERFITNWLTRQQDRARTKPTDGSEEWLRKKLEENHESE